MSGHSPSQVSSHLQIRLEEYDTKIKTFVPYYEEMLDVVSESFALMGRSGSILLDLGIGTGALSGRCREKQPHTQVIGIDADAGILSLAGDRLGRNGVDLRLGNFTDLELPTCDFIVSSLALHHVREIDQKMSLYRRCRAAVTAGGAMILADCFLPSSKEQTRAGLARWSKFLESQYTVGEARSLVEAWGREDTYFPLTDEISWLGQAGFEADVVWRKDVFAVVVCA